MYRLLVAIALILPLSGCGTALGVRWESWQDQRRHPPHIINCSGPGHSWDHCHRSARDRCGVKEYIVISLAGDGGVTVSARSMDPSRSRRPWITISGAVRPP